MSRLRESLIEIQQEEILRSYLGNEYDSTPQDQKNRFLDIVRGQILIDVDKMLREYIIDFEASSPEAKKNGKLKYIYIAANIVLTAASGYAVNEEAWVFLIVLSVLMLLNQVLPFIYNSD